MFINIKPVELNLKIKIMFLIIISLIILITFGYETALVLAILAMIGYFWNLIRHMYNNNNRTRRYYEKNKF